MKNCFVIMPFEQRFDGIWMAIIKPVIQKLGHKCSRADDFFTTGSILEDILNSIKTSDYIIADLTLHNPNVYYELGFAHALQKKTILLTQALSVIPFDLKHQRIILYSDTASGAIKLSKDLSNFAENI